MMVENIIRFFAEYGAFVGFGVLAAFVVLYNKQLAMKILKDMMLAAARMLRKGYLENSAEMKMWVVGKYDVLPAGVKLVISKDAWGKLVDLVAEKAKEFCKDDEAISGEVSR